jgi:D-serine deaminase-like pyridoxal phosphate-dependent protein
VLTFAGHAYGATDADDLASIAIEEIDAIEETVDALARSDISCTVRSIGSTPTLRTPHPGWAGMRLRPGNYVFNDATQMALGVATESSCSLSVLTTVISRPALDRIILDCGSKALSADRMTDRTVGFGVVRGHPEVHIERLFEEHGIASVPRDSVLSVGDRVLVIPNHACTTVNLYDELLVLDDQGALKRWPIRADRRLSPLINQ